MKFSDRTAKRLLTYLAGGVLLYVGAWGLYTTGLNVPDAVLAAFGAAIIYVGYCWRGR